MELWVLPSSAVAQFCFHKSQISLHIFWKCCKLAFCRHFYLYIFVDKNIKNWYGLKSRFVWFFLRDSETLPRMPVGLCCTAGKMIFLCTWVKLSSTDLCSSTAKFWNWVHQSTLKKEKEKDLSFWIQSTFPSYQIITCPVCLDTLCNWTTKTSYRFQTSRDWYHFSTFCTGECLEHWDLDLIWISNL